MTTADLRKSTRPGKIEGSNRPFRSNSKMHLLHDFVVRLEECVCVGIVEAVDMGNNKLDWQWIAMIQESVYY